MISSINGISHESAVNTMADMMVKLVNGTGVAEPTKTIVQARVDISTMIHRIFRWESPSNYNARLQQIVNEAKTKAETLIPHNSVPKLNDLFSKFQSFSI